MSDGELLPSSSCQAVCPPDPSQNAATACSLQDWEPVGSNPDAGAVLTCTYPGDSCFGRRPWGLGPLDRQGARDGKARHLLEMAFLEAASVHAFHLLERDLRAKGAPARLRTAARRAARDEARHTRIATRFAERAGARVPQPHFAPCRGVPSLEAIATENAVEGCVGETYGAALALRQAQCARDPELREAMKGIARDEMRHAALAWEVARWLEPKLSPAARRRVLAARARAVEALFHGAARRSNALVGLGLPDGDQARALLGELERRLWS